MQPANTPHHPVTVEYTAKGQRVSKTFACPFKARSFYVAKAKAGAAPKVVKAAE
jgi:hypothetical protein